MLWITHKVGAAVYGKIVYPIYHCTHGVEDENFGIRMRLFLQWVRG